MNPFGVMMCVVGVIVLLAAAMDAAWLMDSARARFVSHLLTPVGARIFYVVIGAAALAFGVMLVLGSPPAQPTATPATP